MIILIIIINDNDNDNDIITDIHNVNNTHVSAPVASRSRCASTGMRFEFTFVHISWHFECRYADRGRASQMIRCTSMLHCPRSAQPVFILTFRMPGYPDAKIETPGIPFVLHIYIYIYRERERETNIHTYIYLSMYVYIYIYICMCVAGANGISIHLSMRATVAWHTVAPIAKRRWSLLLLPASWTSFSKLRPAKSLMTRETHHSSGKHDT